MRKFTCGKLPFLFLSRSCYSFTESLNKNANDSEMERSKIELNVCMGTHSLDKACIFAGGRSCNSLCKFETKLNTSLEKGHNYGIINP